MLEKWLRNLVQELDLPETSCVPAHKGFLFRFSEDVEVHISDLEPGVSFQAALTDCPKDERFDLFVYLMRANLLGQGTNGARIGLDAKEKILTLSLGLPYELDYKRFQPTLEDFINHLLFWRKEIIRKGS